MAVAYDTASATQAFSNVSSVTTWTHTASGSDRYVRLSIAWAKLGTTTCSATYGGNAMSSVGLATASANWISNVTGKAQIFEYVAPATSAETVAPTFSASGNYGAAGTVSYTGVDQTTPSGAAFTGSVGNASGVTTSTRTVTDADTGDMVSDCIAVDSGATSVTAGSTQRFNGVGTGYSGAGQDAAGSASVAMTWTWTTNKGYAHVAAAIYQASGGGTPAGISTETDTSLTLSGVQLRAVGQAAETDAAQALAAVQIASTGRADEAETALALTPVQITVAGLASETDAALALDPGAIGAVGVALETDVALALAAVQITATGIATEADSALALTGLAGTAPGIASETDTAFALAAVQKLVAGAALEVDTALALSTPGGTIDLILKILANRQELNPATGTFTLYDNDGTTVLYTTNAWADAAGTVPYSGGALRRIDALF